MRRRRDLSLVVAVCALVAGGCSDSTTADRVKQAHFESGNRYFDAQKYPEAIIEYQNALQQDERFAAARLKLAESFVKAGNGPRAFREYVRAADLLPDDHKTQIIATGYLIRAGQFEDAR